MGNAHWPLESCSLPISLPDLKWLDWNELHLRLALCCLTYACRHDSAKGNKNGHEIPASAHHICRVQTVKNTLVFLFQQENSTGIHLSFVLSSLCSSVESAAVGLNVDVLSQDITTYPLTSVSTHKLTVYTLNNVATSVLTPHLENLREEIWFLPSNRSSHSSSHQMLLNPDCKLRHEKYNQTAATRCMATSEQRHETIIFRFSLLNLFTPHNKTLFVSLFASSGCHGSNILKI